MHTHIGKITLTTTHNSQRGLPSNRGACAYYTYNDVVAVNYLNAAIVVSIMSVQVYVYVCVRTLLVTIIT